MAANTSIEWTDRTWNPVRGCSVISPGCVNCYAMKQAHRFSGAGKPYEGLTKLTKAGPQWTGKIRLVEDALTEPLSWREPQRIFVNSMSDLFHEGVPDEFIDKVFAVMACAQKHTFQVLTKRGGRMERYLASRALNAQHWKDAARSFGWALEFNGISLVWYPLPNVRVGVSIEDQPHADIRFSQVCAIGEMGWDTMVSMEPLLGPVVIPDRYLALGRRAWLIFGGESHQNPDKARPCAIEWIERGVQQCQAAGVAAFVKQLGAKVVSELRTAAPQMFDEKKLKPWMFAPNGEVWAWRAGLTHPKGGDPAEWPQPFPRELPEVRS